MITKLTLIKCCCYNSTFAFTLLSKLVGVSICLPHTVIVKAMNNKIVAISELQIGNTFISIISILFKFLYLSRV